VTQDASLDAGNHAGTLLAVGKIKLKKVTIVLPEALLERAQRGSQRGITETVRQGLELVAARDVYDRLRLRRGQINLDLDLGELRKDRR
jgi:hypothetical protein